MCRIYPYGVYFTQAPKKKKIDERYDEIYHQLNEEKVISVTMF